MFNLIAIALVAGAIYGIWCAAKWLRNDKRILVREAAKLAQQAAAAAKRGDYAERDRLDDARAAILSGLAGREWKPKGSDHDDFDERYFS